jgi:hypothetical protein
MLRSAGGWFAVAVLALLGLTACEDDDSPAVKGGTSDLDAYCAAIADYDELTTNFGTSSIAAVRDSMEQAATALRKAANDAPPEVSDDVVALLRGAEAVADVAETTEGEDLQGWLRELSRRSADVESKIGDLEAETTAVQAHAESVCGLDVG